MAVAVARGGGLGEGGVWGLMVEAEKPAKPRQQGPACKKVKEERRGGGGGRLEGSESAV